MSSYDGNRRANMLCGVPAGAGRVRFVGTCWEQKQTMITGEEVAAFFTVIGIDLVLSGDNAIVIGAAAAGLPPHLRRRAITIGIAVAALTRMGFAMIAFYLLKIVGLLFAGGLLLLWVAWNLWRQIRAESKDAGPQREEAWAVKISLRCPSPEASAAP